MQKFKFLIVTFLLIIPITFGKESSAAAAGIEAPASKKPVTGALTSPDGHYTKFYGMESQTSHLYRGQVVHPIPAVPMLHPYNDFIHPWIGLGAKIPTEGGTFPAFVTELPGELAPYFHIVIQDTPDPRTHIVRLNYLLHTKDNEGTDGIDLAVGAPTGLDSVSLTDGEAVEGGYKRVSSHTHPAGDTVVASPDIGKLDFGKAPNTIGTASFWMVHRIGGVKTPTLFILINDIEKSKIYRSALGHSPDMASLMAGLSVEGLADDAATHELKKALGYE